MLIHARINKELGDHFTLMMWFWDTKKTCQKIVFFQTFYNWLEQCPEVLQLLFLELSKYMVIFFSVHAQSFHFGKHPASLAINAFTSVALFFLPYCKSSISQIFIFPCSSPPWNSLIFLLLLQIVHIKCRSLCFSFSNSLRCRCTSFHMCISAWNSCCPHSKAMEGQWCSYLEPQGETDINCGEQELLGKNSVFFCPKEGERTNF